MLHVDVAGEGRQAAEQILRSEFRRVPKAVNTNRRTTLPRSVRRTPRRLAISASGCRLGTDSNDRSTQSPPR